MKVLYRIKVCAINWCAFSFLPLFSAAGSQPASLRQLEGKDPVPYLHSRPLELLEQGGNTKQTASEAVLSLF